jgi:regulator of nonsense transcripts 2
MLSLIIDATHTISANGKPAPENYSPLDEPNDFFRVRLICTLLDTCGSCFDRGILRKKLDNFLVFFQVGFYILS